MVRTNGIGVMVAASALCALTLATERQAAACGGCFHPPTQTATDITDERMLLSVSTTQTTLFDQIQYSGNPTSFAWVLPIHGTVQVGLSADVLFDSIDAVTATQIVAPPSTCPGPPDTCGYGFGNAAPSAGRAAEDAGAAEGAGTVTVTQQENVGPYETVQLHSTDASALNNWLTQNGFVIPSDVVPVIDAYVQENFNFLAMKLLPNQGIQAMRPVRVTMPGASLSLPLRMAAIGTGSTVGITIWVVSDGRYEPQNFPFFHIEDSQLVWNWATELSNYTTLRAQDEAALGGKGWEIESSLTLAQSLITGVIVSGGVYYGGYAGGFGGGIAPAQPADAGADYLPTTVSSDGGSADGGSADGGQTAEEVRAADINALFGGLSGPNVRVTRMRSDISHAAMTQDFVLQASSDQSELSNIRDVTQSINEVCPIYSSSCSVVGSGTPAQAAAQNGTTSGGSGVASGSNAQAGAQNGVSSGSSGCSSASHSGETPAGLSLLLGGLGLVLARAIRHRRRNARRN
jgi:MYXO-CTERM domain-containing protein